MTDIENLDVDETKIHNPYANNSYWKDSNNNQNISVEDFEYEKKKRIYLQNKDLAYNFSFVLCFKMNVIAYITVTILTVLLYLDGIICSIFLFKDGNLTTAGSVAFGGSIVGLLSFYVITEIIRMYQKLPFQKTQFFKNFKKSLKHNKKEIRKWMHTVRPPKKEKDEWTFDDYFSEE